MGRVPGSLWRRAADSIAILPERNPFVSHETVHPLVHERAAGAMTKLGLVRNPRSLRNRDNRDGFRRRASDALGDLFAEADAPEDLVPILAEFARREVGLLAIDGGDGTVHRVLTALPAAFGENLPQIAIIPSGNTNLIASDIGCRKYGTKTLMQLVDVAAGLEPARQLRKRATIDVHWLDNAHPPARGMFLGAAAFTRGIDFAHGRRYVKTVTHHAAVAGAIFASLAKAYAGRAEWFAGDAMTIAPVVEGTPRSNGRANNRFLFLATTLHKLGFGLWPFWGALDAPIRYLDIDAHPRHVLRALLAVLRGRAPDWLRESGEYHSGSADTIGLELRHRFVLDGETFEPGPSGKVELRSGRVLDFVAV
jgi:hypothetical protein